MNEENAVPSPVERVVMRKDYLIQEAIDALKSVDSSECSEDVYETISAVISDLNSSIMDTVGSPEDMPSELFPGTLDALNRIGA